MVIAVWLTFNVSADGTGLLEQLGPRPVDAGSGNRPVSRSMPYEHRPQCPMLLAS
jgi:hypothetical protein